MARSSPSYQRHLSDGGDQARDIDAEAAGGAGGQGRGRGGGGPRAAVGGLDVAGETAGGSEGSWVHHHGCGAMGGEGAAMMLLQRCGGDLREA